MSDERWIKLDRHRVTLRNEQAVQFELGEAFDAAEGQRVESIRWCLAHDSPERLAAAPFCWKRWWLEGDGDCEFADDATLILPPKDAS